jgi:hypothetical protein
MADHRFDYPTAALPTTSLVFVRGARLVSDTPLLRLNQEVGQTKGGTTRAKSYGPAKRVYPLTAIFAISGASEADFEDVVTWIDEISEGAVNAFEWSDEHGTVRTVRIVNGNEISFPKFGHDSQSCTFQLEVQ